MVDDGRTSCAKVHHWWIGNSQEGILDRYFKVQKFSKFNEQLKYIIYNRTFKNHGK